MQIEHANIPMTQELPGKGQEEGCLSAYLQDPASFYQHRTAFSASFPPLIEFLFRGTFEGTAQLPTAQIPR